MWSSIEQSVGIVCACLPTLRPLLRCGNKRPSSDSGCAPVRPAGRDAFHRHDVRASEPRWSRPAPPSVLSHRSHPRSVCEYDDVEKSSQAEIVLDSKKRAVMAISWYEGDGQKDETCMPTDVTFPLPVLSIVRTREIHQDVETASLRRSSLAPLEYD